MYKRKRLSPRIKSWGTPTLNVHLEDVLPSKTTKRLLLLRNDEIRWNNLPDMPEALPLWKREAWQNLSKAFDISSATAWVAPETLKAPAIQLVTTVKISAVQQGTLTSY